MRIPLYAPCYRLFMGGGRTQGVGSESEQVEFSVKTKRAGEWSVACACFRALDLV